MAEENKTQEILEAQKCLFDVEIKSVNEEDKSVKAVFSTSAVDRMGDIVDPEALLAGSKNFIKNPVLMNSHEKYDLTKIIGKVSDLQVQGKKFAGTVIYFAGQGNPAADWAFNLAKQGIAAFSIGFRGLEYEYIKAKSKYGDGEVVTGLHFTKVELLEISQVAVPANQEALMKAYETFSKSKVAQVPQASEEKTQVKKLEGKELTAKFAEFLKS